MHEWNQNASIKVLAHEKSCTVFARYISKDLQFDLADIVRFSREINFKSLVTGSSKL